MAWNASQQKALAIVPKVSSVFSLFGSMWIIIEVLTGVHNGAVPNRTHPYHRLLLAMSIYDVLESVWNFASTWPIPKGTAGVYGASGNRYLCTAQGFFLCLSVSVPIYNAFLSLYYVLVVNYSMTEKSITRKVEPWMHGIAFAWGFGTAIVSATMGLMNNANLWCWIAPFPAGCDQSWKVGKEAATCTRGDNSDLFRWGFYFAPLWLCILFAAFATLTVCTHVKNLDRKTRAFRKPERFSFYAKGKAVANPSSMSLADNNSTDAGSQWDESNCWKAWLKRRKQFADENPRTVQVQVQAFWYLIVFFLTHTWSTTNRLTQLLGKDVHFEVVLIHSFFDPLQGFLNYVVYQRPRYLRVRKINPEFSRLRAIRAVLRFTCQAPDTSASKSRISSEVDYKTSQVMHESAPLSTIQEKTLGDRLANLQQMNFSDSDSSENSDESSDVSTSRQHVDDTIEGDSENAHRKETGEREDVQDYDPDETHLYLDRRRRHDDEDDDARTIRTVEDPSPDVDLRFL